MPFAPQLLGELDTDLVALLRGYFSRTKALIGVISHIAVHFVKQFLNGQHFPERSIPAAVDAGDEHGLILSGFLPIARVTEHNLQIRVLRFFRISGVFNHSAHTVLDGPDFGYCHPASPAFSRWKQVCIMACAMVCSCSATTSGGMLVHSCCSRSSWPYARYSAGGTAEYTSFPRLHLRR